MTMKETKNKLDRTYVISPNGEKRPKSSTANAVHVLKLATGQAEEEYVEQKANRQHKRTADD